MARSRFNTTSWTGSNRARQPHAPYGQGYDAHTVDKQWKKSRPSGWLIDNGDRTHVELWVTDVGLDLSLNGSTAQSQASRDFYPRNFSQPTVNITAQAPGHQEMGRVAEFIHKAQKNCITKSSLMQLYVPMQRDLHVKRGRMRQNLNVHGYVQNISRTHRAGIAVETYTFGFVISQMFSGLFIDTPPKVYTLARWADIFDKVVANNLVTPPQAVDWTGEEEADTSPLDRPSLAPGPNGQLRPT